MAIISQETWDNMPEAEKEKLCQNYSEDYDAETRVILDEIFGKENLQPKPKIRTWKDIVASSHNIYDKELNPNCGNTLISCITNEILKDKLSLKCDATIKIAKLIELGYGGMVTEKEWKDDEILKFGVKWNYKANDWAYHNTIITKEFIVFHTPEQREEFMSYPENRALVEQYYLITNE